MPQAARRIEQRNAVLHIYDEDPPLGKTESVSPPALAPGRRTPRPRQAR